MTDRYDVLIVGARCAGAALATLLFRCGIKTLVIDAASLPSDMVMSTHYLHSPSMDVLDELAVGDRVRAIAPPCPRFTMAVETHRLVARYPEDRAGYCPRRLRLDAFLQEAAIPSGAEIRDRHKLVDLARDGERVKGAVVRTPHGEETIRTDLVVGADGRHSRVAARMGVEEYLGCDMSRGACWMYWPKPRAWTEDSRYAFDSLIALEGDGIRYVFQCDEDLLLVVAAPPNAEARSWGKEHRKRYIEYLEASPWTAPLVEDNEPIGKPIGLLKARFFYRRPVGPGFALVGDAGNFKDYVTGHGITDALLGARELAAAIIDGRPEAFEWYWRYRDATTLPFYFDALRFGSVGANDALMEVFTQKAAAAKEDYELRLGMMADRRLPPMEVFHLSDILRWVAVATLRGRFDVFRAFVSTIGRNGGWAKEIAHREALLKQAVESVGTVPTLQAAA